MVKSYRLKDTIKKKKKTKNRSVGELIRAGTGAIIGVALLGTIASSLRR